MKTVASIKLTPEQVAAMMAEYDRRGTCTCPLCGAEREPWCGMWFCECGAMAKEGAK